MSCLTRGRFCGRKSSTPAFEHGDLCGNHVFLFRGKPVRDIRRGLKKACEATGISYGRFTKGGFVLHDQRHGFTTYMSKAGVAESVTMRMTGYSTREMFDRYNRVDQDDMKAAMDKMQALLAASDQ